MTLNELIKVTHENLPIENSKAETGAAIKIMLEEIGNALASGERVTLKGFGSFKPVERGEKQARNFQTGDMVTVPPRKVVKFTMSQSFKDRINK